MASLLGGSGCDQGKLTAFPAFPISHFVGDQETGPYKAPAEAYVRRHLRVSRVRNRSIDNRSRWPNMNKREHDRLLHENFGGVRLERPSSRYENSEPWSKLTTSPAEAGQWDSTNMQPSSLPQKVATFCQFPDEREKSCSFIPSTLTLM